MSGTDSSPHVALVDAHVHFHVGFEPAVFLAAARDHFAAAAARLGLPQYSAYLLLTESADANWFAQLAECATTGWSVAEDWRAERTPDEREVRLVHAGGSVLNVVAGRQVVTAEQLEVLALGINPLVPDGFPLGETLRRVRALGALAVLPWGFGKWLGRRGQRARELVLASEPGEIFLGDNGGRLRGSAEPPLFTLARSKGIGILPGTDPFPFPEQAVNVGRMGFSVRSAQPLTGWPALREAIVAQTDLMPFGELEKPLPFVRNQIAMQLRKRLQRPPQVPA